MMEYALYKGEKFITCGTIKEISDELGISEQTVKFYGTNASKKSIQTAEFQWKSERLMMNEKLNPKQASKQICVLIEIKT